MNPPFVLVLQDEKDETNKRKREEIMEVEEEEEQKREQGFEDLLFEGLLTIVFQELYKLPLTRFSFSSVFVNKRWLAYFQHPLKVFYKGRYNEDLDRYPPSFYAVGMIGKHYVQELCNCGRMNSQIQELEEGDKNREEFIVQEMYAHRIDPVQCRNKRVSEIVDHLIAKNSYHYYPFKWGHPTWRWKKMPAVSAVRCLRVWPLFDDIFVDYCLDQRNNSEFFRLASQEGWIVLRHMADEIKTESLCYEQVKLDTSMMDYVPERFKTEAMYKCLGDIELVK